MFNNKKNLSILTFFLLVLFLFIFQYFSSQKKDDAIMTEVEVITNTSEVSQKSIDEAITETFPIEKGQGSFDVVRIDNDGVSVLAGKSPPNQIIKIYKDDFLIAEGLSDVQVRSITNSVEGELREKARVEPIRKEGINEAKWALLDYGDLIVNIFQPEIRKYYDLESFWSNGDNLIFP